jgi:hypothetical protein
MNVTTQARIAAVSRYQAACYRMRTVDQIATTFQVPCAGVSVTSHVFWKSCDTGMQLRAPRYLGPLRSPACTSLCIVHRPASGLRGCSHSPCMYIRCKSTYSIKICLGLHELAQWRQRMDAVISFKYVVNQAHTNFVGTLGLGVHRLT